MSAIVCWVNVSWNAAYCEDFSGLMQHSFFEIKEKLLRALDSEYNVRDMGTVFEVVAVLEKAPITPEILETTRLGKVINECRRRTTNEALAKRAKQLLRVWRNMMGHMMPTSSCAAASTSPVAVAQPPMQQQPINGRSSARRHVYDSSGSISPASSLSPAAGENSKNLNMLEIIHDTRMAMQLNALDMKDSKMEAVPRTHASNKRPRIGDEEAPPAKVPKVNGVRSAEYTRLRDSTPPSVVEMVTIDDELPVNSTDAPAVTSTMSTQPSSKKRGRKKSKKQRAPLEDDIVKQKLVALSRTVRVKTTEELVAALQQRSDPQSSQSATSSSSPLPPTPTVVTDTSRRVVAHGEDSADCEVAAIMARLPPLNREAIVWDDESEVVPSKSPLTDDAVERYLNGQWDGQNGCRTEPSGEFRTWDQMVARRTGNDELIHVLPYSIVD